MSSREVVEAVRREFQTQFKKCLIGFERLKARTLKQKGAAIGLDVGTTSVKMVELQQQDGRMTVLRAERVPVDPADKEGGVAKALQKVLGGVSLKESRLASIVSDPQGSFHRLVVPQMPPSELREALSWELKDQTSVEIAEAEFDYEILQPIVEKGVKKWEVLVTVLPRETVRRHLSLLHSVGVTPSRLIQGPVAFQLLLKRSLPASDEPIAILDMGHCVTEISMFQRGSLEFSRRLPVSGSDFTKALTGPLQSGEGMVVLTLEEAEKIKCAYGLLQKENAPLAGQPTPSQVLPLIRPVAERLASEIERSLIFYQERSNGGKVARLLLFGGGATLKDLAPFLADSLGIEVVTRDPFEGFPVGSSAERVLREAPQEFALALGAALGVEGKINLLPQEVKEQTRRLVERAFLKGALTTVVVLLLFLYAGMRIEATNRYKKIGVARLELSALTPLLDEARQKTVLKGMLTREPYWEDLFKELSHILPEQVYLRSLGWDQGRLVLEGIIVTGREDPEGLLSGLLSDMEKGIFRNSSLVETEKQGEGKGSSFKIQTELD